MSKQFWIIRRAELFMAALLAFIPLAIHNPFVLGLLTLLTIYAIALIGLDVSVGYLGQTNLGHTAFLGLGAYTAALLVNHYHVDILTALAAGALLGMIVGGLLALPALRLEGPQFALATLSFTALTGIVLNEWEALTAGAQGLQLRRPLLAGHGLSSAGFYWFCLVLLALVCLGMKNLLRSQWGRAFEALRDSPIATDAMGIGTYRHKILAFALGSGLGGLAGGLYACNFEYLQPQIFNYELMVMMLLGVVLGGRKNLMGCLVGAIIIVLLPNLLSNRSLFQVITCSGLVLALAVAMRGLRRKSLKPFAALALVVALLTLVVFSIAASNIEDLRKAIFALILFAVIVGMPEGLMGWATRSLTRLFRLSPPRLAEPIPLEQALPSQPKNSRPLLVLSDIKCHFGGVRALDGVSLVVYSGETHGLIGPNGSGKSTLVNVISGLYSPKSGSMRLHNKELPRGSLYRVAHQGLARTFQNLQTFKELSVLDNVMVSLRDMYRRPMPLILLGLGRREERRAQASARSLLDFVGLENQAGALAGSLSYGSQRFLEIARALARRPELLILDEPAAGLAHQDVQQLIAIIKRIQAAGIAIVLIEHHMEVVSEVCDRVTVLDGGLVIAEGSPAAIKCHPEVVRAYLGGQI